MDVEKKLMNKILWLLMLASPLISAGCPDKIPDNVFGTWITLEVVQPKSEAFKGQSGIRIQFDSGDKSFKNSFHRFTSQIKNPPFFYVIHEGPNVTVVPYIYMDSKNAGFMAVNHLGSSKFIKTKQMLVPFKHYLLLDKTNALDLHDFDGNHAKDLLTEQQKADYTKHCQYALLSSPFTTSKFCTFNTGTARVLETPSTYVAEQLDDVKIVFPLTEPTFYKAKLQYKSEEGGIKYFALENSTTSIKVPVLDDLTKFRTFVKECTAKPGLALPSYFLPVVGSVLGVMLVAIIILIIILMKKKKKVVYVVKTIGGRKAKPGAKPGKPGHKKPKRKPKRGKAKRKPKGKAKGRDKGKDKSKDKKPEKNKKEGNDDKKKSEKSDVADF